MPESIDIGTIVYEASTGERAVQVKIANWATERRTCDELLNVLKKHIDGIAKYKAMAEKADELTFWTAEERAVLVGWGVLK
jgi:hypothetical protein